MTIRVVALFTVPAANVARFKQFVADATASVRKGEAGRTLTYDFFASGAGDLDCVAHEVYADSDAFVAHLENLGEKVAVALEIFKVDRMIITGQLPDALVTQIRAIGGPNTYYYGDRISSL